jgi:sugar lactone lactonase YvrE
MHTTTAHTLFLRTGAFALSLAGAALLAGCSAGMNVAGPRTSSPIVPSSGHMQGKVYGGQQPISGATIQLYAVGTTGIGSAATPLLSPPATTDSNGSFDITGQYQCPQQGSLTYLVATGGNPGLSPGTNNAAIALLAALGPCNTPNPDTNGDGGVYYTLSPLLFVNVNEVTTVASVYALAPFMNTYYSNVGSSSPTGIATAFANVNLLVNIATGKSPGLALPSSVTYNSTYGFPIVINSLANVIAACVNSNGNNSACSNLFSDLTSPGVYPSDTVGAVLAMATHPSQSVTDIFSLASTTPPFAPSLTNPPNDWTMPIQYTGLNLSSPGSIAFDSLSNLWIANVTGAYVTELYSGVDGINAAGTSTQITAGGILGPQSLAVDLSNNIWIANTAGDSVVELDDNGNVLSGTGFTAGGINAPVSIALDSNGNAWVANFNGNSITQLLPDGTPSSFSPITQGAISAGSVPISLPTFVAVDSNNDVWVSNSGLNTTYGLTTGMLRFDQNGNPQSCSTQNLAAPIGIAFDASGTAWIAANGLSAVQPLTSACTATASAITGGGLNGTVALAVDGAGTVWAANANGSISELTASTGITTSPSTGLAPLNKLDSIAIDTAGSLWTANPTDNSITEFIGLAAPATASPLVATGAAKTGKPYNNLKHSLPHK